MTAKKRVERDLRIAILPETLYLETDEEPVLGEPGETEVEKAELRGVSAEIQLLDPLHIAIIVRKPRRGSIVVEYDERTKTARISYATR